MQNNLTVSFNERDRYMTVSAWGQASWCQLVEVESAVCTSGGYITSWHERQRSWRRSSGSTAAIPASGFNSPALFRPQAVLWDSAQSIKVEEVTQGPWNSAFAPQKSFFFVLSQCPSSGLAVFLWRPLAGREGRTVLCTDIDQALAGLEASQRLAAREGR